MNNQADSKTQAVAGSNQEETAAVVESGRTIIVTRPVDGGTLEIQTSPGGQVNLGFEPSAATASREGNSLVFQIDGAGKVVLQDFFAVGDESLPALRLPDGTVVATADFFSGSDLDISTAAGAGQAAPTAQAPGSGGTSYSDLAGDLVGGVDRLGDQGTDYWGRTSDVSEITQPLTLAESAASGNTTTPPPAGNTTTPPPAANTTTPPPANNDTTPPPANDDKTPPSTGKDDDKGPDPKGQDERFVLYMDEPADGISMEGLAQFKQHEAASLFGDDPIYGTASIVDGKLVYTLSEAGALALKDALAGGVDPVFDYMSYVDEHGKEHTVQVVLTTGTEHISKDVVDPDRPCAPVVETHMSEHTGDVYSVESTDGKSGQDGDDVLTFDNDVTGGKINTLGGADEVNLKGMLNAFDKNSVVELNTGSGDDTVSVGTTVRAYDGSATIDLGDGNNRLDVGKDIMADGGSVTISSGDGHDSISIGGEVRAEYGGKVSIDTGANKAGVADDTLSLKNGVYAWDAGSQVNLTSDVVHIKGSSVGIDTNSYTSSTSKVTSTHVTASKNVTIETDYASGDTSAVHSKGAGSENEITAGTDITITATGGGISRGVYSDGTGTQNVIKAGTGITVTATGTGAATAVFDSGSTRTELESETGDITLEATSSSDSAYGVGGYSNNTLITAKDGDISINADGKTYAYGTAIGGTYSAEKGLVHIVANAEEGIAEGTRSNGLNTVIKAEEVRIESTSEKGDLIIREDPFNSSRALGMNTYGGGRAEITADKIVISAEAQGEGNARGVRASAPQISKNTENILQDAEYVEVSATANTGEAHALEAKGSGRQVNTSTGIAKNTVSGDEVHLEATSGTGKAFAMNAHYWDAENHVSGHDVFLKARSNSTNNTDTVTGYAYGMKAEGRANAEGGKNTISATNVTIEVSSGGINPVSNCPNHAGKLAGMHAITNGKNIIDGSDSDFGMTVTIKAAGGWAMSVFTGGENLIKGSDYNDHVILEGGVTNHGKPDGGTNRIETGKGDDTIELNGVIGYIPSHPDFYVPPESHQNDLAIKAGDGYDTLVLHANDPATFEYNYKAWLGRLFSSGEFEGASIESLTVDIKGDGAELSDVSWLVTMIDGYNNAGGHDPIDFKLVVDGELQTNLDFSGIGDGNNFLSLHVDDYLDLAGALKLNGGEGNDTLRLSGSADDLDSVIKVGSIEGFENLILDMSNGEKDGLTLDGLLAHLGTDTKAVYIKGDDTDKVALDTDTYTKVEGPSTIVDGVNYNCYQSADDDALKIYIQEGLI